MNTRQTDSFASPLALFVRDVQISIAPYVHTYVRGFTQYMKGFEAVGFQATRLGQSHVCA